jgi:hypothetical protein
LPEIGYQTAHSNLARWSSFLDEADADPDFQWPKSIGIVDRMRRDDTQVVSMLRAVMLPLLESEWLLDATGVRQEVADHVSRDLALSIKGVPWTAPLRTKGRFSFAEHLPLALLELVHGHSVFEQVYEVDAFGRAHLQKLSWRPPRTIAEFEVARDGGLVAIKQFGTGRIEQSRLLGPIVQGDVRIPVNRLVVYVNEREGSNWAGVSLLRPAYKMWLLKDRTLRVQALASDRNGLGLPIYTSAPPPEGASYEQKKAWLDEEIERGLSIARGSRAGDTAGASLPHGAQLTFSGVEGNLPDLDKQIRYYDEQIGRAALTNFLNLGGDNSTGSYALGDTFENFFTKSLNSLARHIVTVFQQHVIEDLVDANWGPNEPAPRLVAPKIGAEHPATAEAIRALLDSGAIRWDPALEAHLRAQYGLPVRPESDTAGATDVDPRAARAIAETVQKSYLGVGTVLTRREARELARRAGARIDPDEQPTQTQEAS